MSKLIAVFGATGNQGGSVLKALLNSGAFKVRALTRNANSEKAKQLSSLKDCSVAEADLENTKSLEKALKGCYGAFVVTEFNHSPNNIEVQQGINAIDSAVKNGLSHVVFSGLENVKLITGNPCLHMDNKAEIENYGLKKSGKINFTSIRLPFFFENFPPLFFHKVKENQYAITVPLGDKPLFGISVADAGECVLPIFRNPQDYKSKIVGFAASFLTIEEYAAILNKHLAPHKFFDSKMTWQQYAKLGFPGAEELAYMFEYYQTGKMQRDIELTKKLNKNLHDFEAWVVKNKQNILKNLK